MPDLAFYSWTRPRRERQTANGKMITKAHGKRQKQTHGTGPQNPIEKSHGLCHTSKKGFFYRLVILQKPEFMRCINLVTVALLVFADGTSNASERKCPETIHNSYQCSQFLEKELAREHPRLFSRTGSQLVISLANGTKKTYIDLPDEKNYGVEGRWYNLVQYYPEIGYGLIAVQYYEGGTYYLVNMTSGKDKDIISSPEISPDRKRIAVANVDLESRYTPNVLSVFELRPDGLVTEFLEKPDDWGPGNLRWVNNQEISFIQYQLNPKFDPKQPDEILVGTPKKLKYFGARGKHMARWVIE